MSWMALGVVAALAQGSDDVQRHMELFAEARAAETGLEYQRALGLCADAIDVAPGAST